MARAAQTLAVLVAMVVGAGGGLIALAAPAAAALVRTTVTGDVTLAEAGNPLGLGVGDAVTAVAVYDDALVDPTDPLDTLLILSDPRFSLTITLGSFTYTQALESFPPGFPDLLFVDGTLDGIRFSVNPLALGAFTNLRLTDFEGGRAAGLDQLDAGGSFVRPLVEARWSFDSAVTTPLPAAAWLLSGALAALAVVRHRRRR